MMVSIFMQILDMTKIASIVIVVVLLSRLLLKKAPKVISYALWEVVLFRLLCPLSLEVPVSILPDITPTEESYTLADIPITPVAAVEAAYQAVVDAINGGLGVQHIQTELPVADGSNVSVVISTWWEVWILFGQYVWLVGILGMMLYAVVSYIRLRRKLITASPLRDNIYLADEITSPFVMGLIRPKIYLPSVMAEQEQSYIILHEQHHIRRLDHIWKALAFAALCIHWFNPLVWLAFIMAGKDMEMSCDEAVVKKMGDGVLADYTASLLSLATGKHIIAGMPLAFGEGDTKGRIRNLANWKKPAIWVILVAVIVCVVLAVCLLTNPVTKQTTLMGANYEIDEILYVSPSSASTELPLQYCITADYHLYLHQNDQVAWDYLGKLESYALTNEELDGYMLIDGQRKKANVREITDAYMLRTENDHFYLAFQTKSGNTYLAYGWEDVSERVDEYSDDTCLLWLYKLKSSLWIYHPTNRAHIFGVFIA